MKIVRGRNQISANANDHAGRKKEIGAIRKKLARAHGAGRLSGDYSSITGEYFWTWTVDGEELGGERVSPAVQPDAS